MKVVWSVEAPDFKVNAQELFLFTQTFILITFCLSTTALVQVLTEVQSKSVIISVASS